MKTAIIVQARMGSTRLPGKVLADIGGKPLIVHLLERLRVCRETSEIFVAVPENDFHVIANVVNECVIGCGGDENDVAARFAYIIEARKIDVFARVCADSPFIDPTLVDTVIRLVRDSGFDVAYEAAPGGQRVEATRSDVFLRELPKMDDDEREHVLTRLYRNIDHNIHVGMIAVPVPSYPKQVVDTAEDLKAVRALYKRHNGNVPLRMMDI